MAFFAVEFEFVEGKCRALVTRREVAYGCQMPESLMTESVEPR